MKKKKTVASKKEATSPGSSRRKPRNFLSDSGGILPGDVDELRALSGKSKRVIRGVGRPHSIQDEPAAMRHLESLGKIQATKSECASFLRVSEPTLNAFLKRVPAAEEAYERGKALGPTVASAAAVQTCGEKPQHGSILRWPDFESKGHATHQSGRNGPTSALLHDSIARSDRSEDA